MNEIQMVVIWRDSGSTGICGQQVGANGFGNYAAVFRSEDQENVMIPVSNLINKLKTDNRISDIQIIEQSNYKRIFEYNY
jgi:hypothetical protein